MGFKLLFIFFSSFFQQKDSLETDLAAITVTANINSQNLKSTARNVTIIDQKTIAAAPVKTIDAVLQYALNVDVRSRSSFGVQADISIRGGHYDQTLIMVDGVKVNDPQTGHHSLNFPISLAQIERIEVLQGGASRVFGPNAFSGVINIITKKLIKNNVNALASIGQYGSKQFGLGGGFLAKSFYLQLNAEGSKSDGFIANTQFKKGQFQGKVGKVYKNGFLDYTYGQIQNNFGASNFYSPKFKNQYEEVGSVLQALNWNHNIGNSLNSSFIASYRTHDDLYDFDNYRNTNKLASVNFHKTNVADLEYKLRKISKYGKSAIGFEWRSEKVISNRLGEVLKTQEVVKDYPGIFYTKSKTRTNISVFVEHNLNIKKLNISGGTLVNQNSQYGTAFYPGIDLSYTISKFTNIYGSANKSLRYPTFTELYLNTSTLKADPNLKPEKALTYEIGLKNIFKFHTLNISTFYRKTQDAIDKVGRVGQAVPNMENIDNINMFGVEISEVFNVKKEFPNGLIDNVQIGYSYLQADRKENGFQSFYTLNYLKHKFNMGLNMHITKDLSLGAWYTLKSRLGSFQLDKDSPIVTYKPINLVDVRLNYKVKGIKVFLDANNFFNQKYYEFGFVEQPGRWISGGIRF
jgi:vitamin B12 transporter